jgi:predicted type IV restriction endonuclease
MSKRPSAEESFAKAVYKAKPKTREEEAIILVHAMLLSAGFKCTGAHEDEPETDKELVVPQKWAAEKADGVYGFRYKSNNKKNILQMKVVCTGRS